MARDLQHYTKEELLNYIDVLRKQLNSHKYGLYWDRTNDSEAVVQEVLTTIPVLKREKELLFTEETVMDGFPNMLIEGDNYHALIILEMLGLGNGIADVIYIDPPYNTGSEDFIYDDSYVNPDDGYRHSKWLSFMEKRLKIAKEVLTEKGVIFISIDDHEHANLKLLCDSIFGEHRHVGTVVWHKKTQPSFLSKELINVTEYVLVYKNTDEKIPFFGSYSDTERSIEMLNISNGKSVRRINKDSVTIGNAFNGRLNKGLYGNGELKVELMDDLTVSNGIPEKDIVLSGRFKWTQARIDDEIGKGGKLYIRSIKTMRPTLKRGKDTQASVKPPINLQSKTINGMATNTDATNELKDIFGGVNPMSYPKPTALMEFLIKSVTADKKDAVVLDFFAGSGTTAHAVLKLNETDDGKRRFIICTNNEGEICETITYPRMETVITGVRKDGSRFSDGYKDGMIHFKTDFIPSTNNDDQSRYNLAEKAHGFLSILEGTNKLVCEDGATTHYSSANGAKHLFVYSDYYDSERFASFAENVNTTEGEKVVYVFTGSDTVDEFIVQHLPGATVKPIPNKFYDIYREIVEDIKRGEQ